MSFLNKKILNFSNNAFGLDLSDLSIKLIHLKKKGSLDEIRSFGMVELPKGVISNGEIIKKETVILKIKELIQKTKPNKINSNKVICSLPETKAFLRLINLPEMKEEELKEAIKWEIEANIPLSLEKVYFDWQPVEKSLGENSKRNSVLMAAISKEAVNQTLEILEASGLEPVGLEIESLAQIRSLIEKKESEKTTLIIDIGDRRTSFIILSKNIPCFTSSIHFSAGLLTDALAKTLNLSFEDAEEKKMNYGIGIFTKNDHIFKATSSALDGLVSEIEKSTNFYLTELKYSSSIDQIILCGGGALTKGIITYLSKKLNKQIILGNPWINLNLGKKLPPIDKDQSIKYSTAIGLALKGLDYENLP